jgi:excisionase family DNA binding protein
MTIAALPRLYSVAEVADALGFSEAWIRTLCARGQIKSHRIGPLGHHRIPEDELERLLGRPLHDDEEGDEA